MKHAQTGPAARPDEAAPPAARANSPRTDALRRAAGNLWRFALLYAATLLLTFLLQYLAGLVPQEAVRANLLASMDQLQSEGLAPGVLYDGHPRSKLDNLSENYILTYSYYMDTRADPASILTNPGRQIQDPYEELFLQTESLLAARLPGDTHYVRYFLGFRMYVRPMLAVMNYMDARQCILWLVTVLFAAATLAVYRAGRSAPAALAFAFAFAQLNPIVVASSFQYSAVFVLAFAGMLLVPGRLGARCRYGPAPLFFVLGMATQIFDFYTAPLLTFGFPALLLLLDNDARALARRRPFPLLGAVLAAWLAGYVGAWLGKLALTALFTPYNALDDGLSRLAFWLNPAKAGAAEPHLALKAVFYNLINIVDAVPLALEAALLVAWAVCIARDARKGASGALETPVRKEKNAALRARFSRNLPYLAVAALPFVWFAAAARPSYEQFYFQYRSLGMFLFGGLLFLIRTARWDANRGA